MPHQITPEEQFVARIEALQYVVEGMLAAGIGFREADKRKAAELCEAQGKYLADHARKAVPMMSPGSRPIDIETESMRAQNEERADVVGRIYRNAAERIRTSR